MIRRTVTLPELALVAGTRMALGAGIGLLVAERLNDDQRRAVGWTLFAVGALTTVPLAAEVLFRREQSSGAETPRQYSPGPVRKDELMLPDA
jgi:hypothetical protein